MNETPSPGMASTRNTDKKILFLVAACNDNYIRFFNLQGISLPVAFKGRDNNGIPMCFDISPDKSMIAVGYEDDSFIAYHFEVKELGNKVDIIPIMRGVGHRNFVSCIRFD
tara:strand:+ start:1569 stop:1901 length:333 start_codon:yes stop_codon:yes gene_type:complete